METTVTNPQVPGETPTAPLNLAPAVATPKYPPADYQPPSAPTAFFFNAVELVVEAKGLTVKKAEAYLKKHMKEGNLTLVDANGQAVTAVAFAEQLAKLG